MANQLARDPGELQQANFTGQAGSAVPDYIVGGGTEMFNALSNVAGNLSNRLFDMAQKAGLKEVQDKAARVTAEAGDAYLTVQDRAFSGGTGAAAGGTPPSRAQTQSSGAVRKIISDAAARYGLDPNAMIRIAEIESSLNPNAKNPKSSAGGLFQFIDGTAKDYGLRDRFDPAQAADAAARLARDNARYLTAKLGRAPTAGELYLAHQQGAGGAVKLLSNPQALAANVVGADAVKLNGGAGGMTAGEFATLWTRKVDGGAGAAAGATGVQLDITPRAANMAPLQLRRDGTILGDAYDKAVTQGMMWRAEAAMANDLADALDAHGDDPAAYAQAVSTVKERFETDPALADILADPTVKAGWQQAFTERTQAGTRSVLKREMARREADASLAFEEGAEARMREIEAQARAADGPDADAAMTAQTARMEAQIDAALDSGLITPAEASAKRRSMQERATFARVQGTFNGLGDPDAQERFAAQMLADYDKGKGPFTGFDRGTVEAWTRTLGSAAIAQRSAADTATKAQKAAMKRRLDDDIASLSTTGEGLAGLTPQEVVRVLGPEKAEAWAETRRATQRQWHATAGMDTMTPEEMAKRLETLAPKAGTEGYAEKQMVFEAAQKKADAILKARAKDPAGAAIAAFEDLAAAEESVDRTQPQAMQELVARRLAAQDALGVPDMAREPLTATEATALAGRILNAAPDQRTQAMMALLPEIDAAYGPHGEAVMRQVLDSSGVPQALAETGARVWRSRERSSAAKPLDRAREIDAAQGAFAARDGSAFPLPNGKQIDMLMTNPGMAAQFDAKFGPGAAQRWLGQRAKAADAKQEDGGTMTQNADGSENWTPNGR